MSSLGGRKPNLRSSSQKSKQINSDSPKLCSRYKTSYASISESSASSDCSDSSSKENVPKPENLKRKNRNQMKNLQSSAKKIAVNLSNVGDELEFVHSDAGRVRSESNNEDGASPTNCTPSSTCSLTLPGQQSISEPVSSLQNTTDPTVMPSLPKLSGSSLLLNSVPDGETLSSPLAPITKTFARVDLSSIHEIPPSTRKLVMSSTDYNIKRTH